jgi:hypothetical protein
MVLTTPASWCFTHAPPPPPLHSRRAGWWMCRAWCWWTPCWQTCRGPRRCRPLSRARYVGPAWGRDHAAPCPAPSIVLVRGAAQLVGLNHGPGPSAPPQRLHLDSAMEGLNCDWAMKVSWLVAPACSWRSLDRAALLSVLPWMPTKRCPPLGLCSVAAAVLSLIPRSIKRTPFPIFRPPTLWRSCCGPGTGDGGRHGRWHMHQQLLAQALQPPK